MPRKAEKAEGEPETTTEKEEEEGYSFDQDTLIELKNFVHQKRMLLQEHPESPDHQAAKRFEKHLNRRLKEIAWQQFKEDKGIS